MFMADLNIDTESFIKLIEKMLHCPNSHNSVIFQVRSLQFCMDRPRQCLPRSDADFDLNLRLKPLH